MIKVIKKLLFKKMIKIFDGAIEICFFVNMFVIFMLYKIIFFSIKILRVYFFSLINPAIKVIIIVIMLSIHLCVQN